MPAQLISLLVFAAWTALWGAGGWLIIRGAFHTAPSEQIPLALVVGLTINVLFANILGQWMALPLAFFLAAGLVLLLGVGLAWGQKLSDLLRLPVLPGQIFAIGVLTALFTQVERGAPIFDDYAHLPTLSLIAAGDIPPHFALNAAVPYAYHYFLMLFAAEIARVAQVNIWTALDVAKALAFSLTIILSVIWTRRLTRSALAGVLGGMFAALGMGARWLLLLLPSGIVAQIAPQITMLGSASGSGETLADALWKPWAVDGIGPVGFPFAFSNGIFAPGVLGISGPNSTIGNAIVIFFLLTQNRWRGWRGALVSALMISSTALLSEVGVVLSIAGWGGIAILYMLQKRAFRLTPLLWQWLVVVVVGNLLGALQGGAFTDIVAGWLRELQGQSAEGYQTVGFAFSFSPVIVSSHLGVLSLLNPAQLFVALIEVGPVILVLPLLAVWGFKSYRAGRWYEAVMIFSSFLSLASVFVTFTGSAGVRNTSRLYGFIGLCALYAVPLAWIWVRHRSERWKWIIGTLAAVSMFGGLVLLSVKLVGIQRPVYSTFLTELDARVYDAYWNRLEADAIVFDPDPYRGPTVFGRPTVGYKTWFDSTPEMQALKANPDPYALRDAGITHVYLDNFYTTALPPAVQQQYAGSCAVLLEAFEDWQGNTRQLFDIRGCEQP